MQHQTINFVIYSTVVLRTYVRPKCLLIANRHFYSTKINKENAITFIFLLHMFNLLIAVAQSEVEV
jgi:hypothetical protein